MLDTCKLSPGSKTPPKTEGMNFDNFSVFSSGGFHSFCQFSEKNVLLCDIFGVVFVNFTKLRR